MIKMEATVEIKKELKNYGKAKQIFEEFKRIRATLGKPYSPIIDPEKIRRDLSGGELMPLIKKLGKGRR